MLKKPNQTEARRREPTSISHHPSAGTPFFFFFFPSDAMPPPRGNALPPVSSGEPAGRDQGGRRD
jgi:hypothetical protein